jgi:hypothetical protein
MAELDALRFTSFTKPRTLLGQEESNGKEKNKNLMKRNWA